MNDFNTYLTQLQNALKGFTPAERDEIMAEIRSHIEDGLDDPVMGLSKEERIKKVTDELGSPLELGNGLQESKWSHRWINFLLALVPLLVIYLIRFGTIIVISQLNKADPESVLLIPLFIITPTYFVMVFIGQRRRSLVLMLWWLSLTAVFSINAVLMGAVIGVPVWMLAIWTVCLISGSGLLGYTLWLHRQKGLLLAFALIPIMLQLADKLLGIYSVGHLSPEQYGEHIWQALWLNNLLFLSIVAFMFLFPQRHVRWLGLMMSSGIYLLAVFIVWQSLPALILYGSLASLPIIIGILVEYHHKNKNILVSV